MRYWAYFAGKIATASAALWGALALLNRLWPPAPHLFPHARNVVVYVPPRLGFDLGYTLAVLVWFVLCVVAAKFIWFDQVHRCRVCLRRLRMPVETGSWSYMLQLGRPRIEYICPYGHGTLREEELQISGVEDPEWTPHSDDIWEELAALSKDSGDRA